VTEPKASETPDCITTCLDLYEECREICREMSHPVTRDARMTSLIAMKFYAVGKKKNHRVFNELQES
jgi:hypothetical protein